MHEIFGFPRQIWLAVFHVLVKDLTFKRVEWSMILEKDMKNIFYNINQQCKYSSFTYGKAVLILKTNLQKYQRLWISVSIDCNLLSQMLPGTNKYLYGNMR